MFATPVSNEQGVLRCQEKACSVKVQYVELACKCEKVFCAVHRTPAVHKCEATRLAYRSFLVKQLQSPPQPSKVNHNQNDGDGSAY